MKKLIFLTIISTITIAGKNSLTASPTRTGYTRKKTYGQLKRERKNFYKNNSKKKNRKVARKLFTPRTILDDRAR